MADAPEVVNGTGQENNQDNSNNQPQLTDQAGNGNAEATNANGNTENHTVRDDDRC